MKVGCLGDIPFQVSDNTIFTVGEADWSGSVRIATHKRHLSDALTEAVGRDPDEMTLTVEIAQTLGVDVMQMLRRIWAYERDYKPLRLILGDHVYGKYKWLIKSHRFGLKRYDGAGNVIWCSASISLVEYVRR